MNIFFNYCFEKKRLKQLLLWFYHEQGEYKTLKLLEKLKTLGFTYATQSGLSIGLEDLQVNLKKSKIMRLTELEIQHVEINQTNANITSFEKFQQMITIWINRSDAIKKKIINNFQISKDLNPLYLMAFSGARGNMAQVRQLVGIRGLMSDPQGNILDFPIRSNFREGLTLTEYIISCYGARKGLVDTALRTATSGYLTRRLVDVAQHVFIERQNCHTSNFIWIQTLYQENTTLKSLKSRLIGRALGKNLFIKKAQMHFSLNSCITSSIAHKLTSFFHILPIKSPLTCNSLNSICQFCYGWNLASEKLVSLGEAIGVLAAQSIGEPGTQLTMRTFHTGGVFSGAVVDQIYSPSNGYIIFPTLILGHLIRTLNGQIGFLTKQDSFLFLKTSAKKFVFQIPTCSIVYVKQQEYVFKEQLLAQLQVRETSLDAPLFTEQHTYTDYNGQIFFENITIFQKKSFNSIIRQYTQTLGTIWIAKVCYCMLVVKQTIIANRFDLIDQSVYLQQFNLVFQNLFFFIQKKAFVCQPFQNSLKTHNNSNNSQFKTQMHSFEFKNSIFYSHLYFKHTCYFLLHYKSFNPFLNLKFFTFLNGFSTSFFKYFDYSSLKFYFQSFRTYHQYMPTTFNSKTYYQQLQNHITLRIACYWKQVFVYNTHFFYKRIPVIQCLHLAPFQSLFYSKQNLNFYPKQNLNFYSIQTISPLCFVPYGLNCSLFLKSKITLFYLHLFSLSKSIQAIHAFERNTQIGQFIQLCYPITIHKKTLVEYFVNPNNSTQQCLFWYACFVKTNQPFSQTIQSGQFCVFYYRELRAFYSMKYIFKNWNTRFVMQNHQNPIRFMFKLKLNNQLLLMKTPNQFWKQTTPFYIKKQPIHYVTHWKLNLNILESFYLNLNSFLIQKPKQSGEFIRLKTFNKWVSKFETVLYSPAILWDARLLNFVNLPSTRNTPNTTNCVFKIIKQKQVYLNFKMRLIYFLPIQTSEFLKKNSDNSIAFINLNNFRTYVTNSAAFFLGQFYYTTNNHYYPGIIQPGLIYTLTKNTVTLRKAEPKLLSANGIVHVQHRSFVKKNAHFFTMFYTYSQTGDIVQGIPKIEDFFEARHQFYNNPFFTDLQTRLIYLYNKYRAQFIHEKAVRKAILKIQTIIVEEVQTIYTLQGIVISDKHIEIIVRQMTSKVRITSGGSTGLLNGELVDLRWIEIINGDLKANKIQYEPLILGITKTCLETSSFISAASFQETIRVLTQSAVQNKLDFICGLKENIILGHLIPAGTGFFVF